MKESKRNLSSSESHPKELAKLRNTIDNLVKKNGNPTELFAPFDIFIKSFPWADILKKRTPVAVLITPESLTFTANSKNKVASLCWNWKTTDPHQVYFEKKCSTDSSDISYPPIIIVPTASNIESIDRLLNNPKLKPAEPNN